MLSFIPASSNRELYAVLAVMAVAVLGFFARRATNAPASGSAPSPPSSLDVAHAEPEDEPDGDDADLGAVTSDGWAFLPDGDEVQIVPPSGDDEDQAEALGHTTPVVVDRNTGALEESPRRRAMPAGKPGEHLDAGDLTGARVVRGAPGVDPWRLEALGREGEYRSWAFETEDAARAALGLLETRIVRAPLDPEDGERKPPDDAEYAAAAALMQTGIAEVALDPGDPTADDR